MSALALILSTLFLLVSQIFKSTGFTASTILWHLLVQLQWLSAVFRIKIQLSFLTYKTIQVTINTPIWSLSLSLSFTLSLSLYPPLSLCALHTIFCCGLWLIHNARLSWSLNAFHAADPNSTTNVSLILRFFSSFRKHLKANCFSLAFRQIHNSVWTLWMLKFLQFIVIVIIKFFHLRSLFVHTGGEEWFSDSRRTCEDHRSISRLIKRKVGFPGGQGVQYVHCVHHGQTGGKWKTQKVLRNQGGKFAKVWGKIIIYPGEMYWKFVVSD